MASIRETPPLREYWIATAPNGRRYRWSTDELQAANVLADLSDEDSVPGGFKQYQATLPRKPGVDYGDMKVGTHLEGFGAGRMPLGEYRLERAPRNVGDYLTMDPAAYGYQGTLEDDKSAAEIFIDGDLSGFAAPPTARQIQLIGAAVAESGNFEAAVADSQSASGLVLNMSGVQSLNDGHSRGQEAWYFGGGVDIGAIHFEFVGDGTTPWSTYGGLSQVDHDGRPGSGFALTANQGATSNSHVTLTAPGPGYKWALISCLYSGTFAGQMTNVERFNWVKVMGRHGLPLGGTWPNVGLLASDVIAYAVGGWTPLKFTTGEKGTIRPTTVLIPQLAFKEAGPVAEWVKQANRLELNEWGVWDKKTFYLNPRGEREGRRKWRTRVRPSKLKDTGEQMDRRYTGVVVQFTDPDGSTRKIGPPGVTTVQSNDERLADNDPSNPLNQAKEKRTAVVTMQGFSTAERALEVGIYFLILNRELDSSGTAELQGYVEDSSGALWPYTAVRSGDLIDFVDSSIPGYRYIINVARNRSSLTATITLDSPKDAMEALLEEVDAVLEPYSL